MKDRGAEGAQDGVEAREVVALAQRPSEGVGVARTMTVDLPPAAVLDVLRRLAAMAPRSPGEENRLEVPRHDGKSFYALTRDGIVLWRRPKVSGQRGLIDPVPYPDMLEARIEPTPRGSRVELRWRPHPRTRRARRAFAITLALAAAVAVLWSMLSPGVWMPELIGLLFTVLAPLAYALLRYRRAARDRLALQPVLLRALEALTPYELGPADLEGSAFRALPARGGHGSGPSRDRRR